MSNLADPCVLNEMTDVAEGDFNVVQDDLPSCYRILSGSLCKMADALLHIISRNVMIRGQIKTVSGVQKKGSFFSNPISTDEIASFCVVASDVPKARTSVQRYVSQLIDMNIFYRFGRKGIYCYTYERDIVSWAPFSSGQAYVYPHTIAKMLSSKTDLWNLIWNRSEGRGLPAVMTFDGFKVEFAKFIDGLLDRLPPSVKEKFRRFDEREDPLLYVNEVGDLIKGLDPYAGYHEHATFEIARLPACVAADYRRVMTELSKGKQTPDDDFADIIPEEDGGSARGIRRPSQRRIASAETYIVRDMCKVNTLFEDALKPSTHPKHLLSLLERGIKRVKGYHQDPTFVISRNLNIEIGDWRKLVDKLRDEGDLSDKYLKEWVDWFNINCAAKLKIDSRTVLVREFVRTQDRFESSRAKEESEEIYSAIYDDMRRRYDGVTPVETLCSKYGWVLTYNFVRVKYSAREVKSVYADMMARFEESPEPEMKRELVDIQRVTYSFGNEFGFLATVDKATCSMIMAFFEEKGCSPTQLGLAFKRSKSSPEIAFWKKVVNENERKRRASTEISV